jgi:hypothetical protein
MAAATAAAPRSPAGARPRRLLRQHPHGAQPGEVARQGLGQPVLGNASTKLLMRQEAKDLEALRDLLGLTEAECELLGGAQRGEGLLLGGNQRVRLRVEVSPHEAELIAGAVA